MGLNMMVKAMLVGCFLCRQMRAPLPDHHYLSYTVLRTTPRPCLRCPGRPVSSDTRLYEASNDSLTNASGTGRSANSPTETTRCVFGEGYGAVCLCLCDTDLCLCGRQVELRTFLSEPELPGVGGSGHMRMGALGHDGGYQTLPSRGK